MYIAIGIILIIVAAQVLFVACLPKILIFETFFGFLFATIFAICCFCAGNLVYSIAGWFMIAAIVLCAYKTWKAGDFY